MTEHNDTAHSATTAREHGETPPAASQSDRPSIVSNTISPTATITGTVIQAGNIYAPGGLRL
ncbi:hypothetical protein [Streptomyces litchfieldiae]|uniref:Uncharacterized protein n=1 Tax=Streptomyces litchfieldiae TaxID=3075543 RepID=A0ABU2N0S7_9ACTN|nr:hypothetical protein [Streptomyces sp. DSM 44938]MDT0347512.1 hypothetical protein [Streptomyces sp. DSM 44938]